MIQLTALKGKLKGHYEKLKQNFHQIFIGKYIQQVSHPASNTEQPKYIKLNPMGKSMIYQLDHLNEILGLQRTTLQSF